MPMSPEIKAELTKGAYVAVTSEVLFAITRRSDFAWFPLAIAIGLGAWLLVKRIQEARRPRYPD